MERISLFLSKKYRVKPFLDKIPVFSVALLLRVFLSDFQESLLLWSLIAFIAAWLYLSDDGEDDDDGSGGMLQPVYQGTGT